MTVPVFDVEALDRLIEQEHEDHRAYKAAEREVEELRKQLALKEKEMAELDKFPRWGMSKAAQYTSNYIYEKLNAMSDESTGGSE